MLYRTDTITCNNWGVQAEKEMAKSRIEVAHEVRMAREAEAAMDYHVQKAAEKAAEHEKKYPLPGHAGGEQADDSLSVGSQGRTNSSGPASAGYNSSSAELSNNYSSSAAAESGHNKATYTDAPSTLAEEDAVYPSNNPQ